MALGRLNWGQAPHDTEAVGQGPHSDILNAVPVGSEHPREPSTVDDTELVQATPAAPLIAITGVVNTRPVPTISAGSQQHTITTTGTAHKLGGNDPRRANMTIVATQPYFLSSSHAQVQQGVCALIPANTAVVITHRDNVFVGAGTGAVLPFIVSNLSENWAT